MKTKSRRLETIAELAMPCTCGGDIGTDHSWLPIILIQKGKWKRAVASDLRRGPLLAAEKNIAENGLSKQIEMRLGPGLKPYRPGECDNFVIAGMGGPEICAIIEESIEVASSAKELVLQPNTAEYEVRRYLDGRGFEITEERVAVEQRHVYLIIRGSFHQKRLAASLRAPQRAYTMEERIAFHTGSILYKRDDQETVCYYQNLRRKTERILKGMSCSLLLDPADAQRQAEYQALYRWLEHNAEWSTK